MVCVLLVLPGLLSGCGSFVGGVGCTTSANPAFRVFVTDAATEQNAATGATVVVTEGGFTETLQPVTIYDVEGRVEEVLNFSGVLERAGTYTIRVAKPGYLPFVRRNVRVTENECHVNTRTVNVTLTPES